MKKTLSLLLVLALFFSLCACDKESTKQTKRQSDKSSLLMDGNGYYHDSEYKIIKYSRFGECIKEVVELTTDNWSEYINLISYAEEVIEYDTFGEITDQYYVDKIAFGFSSDKYYYRYEDVAVEFEHKTTGEKTIYEIRNGEFYNTDFDINQYTCSRIKGRIYVVEIPEEAILETPPKPDYPYTYTSIVIGSEGSEAPYEINPHTRVIHHNGTENWQEKFMK